MEGLFKFTILYLIVPASIIIAQQIANNQIKFKNESGNSILTITDEGNNAGSILLPQIGVPFSMTSTTNKLYNVNGLLYFNGSPLGTSGASQINDLSDAIYDGSSLFLGAGAGTNDDGTSNSNTAVGKDALHLNTTGKLNSATGAYTLYANTAGEYNTANGYAALSSNTIGTSNTADGRGTLYSNTTGSSNTAAGATALFYNVAGNNGVAIGFESQMYANDMPISYNNANTSVGYQSLRGSTNPSNNTGNSNSAFGHQAIYSNMSGNNNTAIGAEVLSSNTTGSSNTAIGRSALYSNIAGNNSVAIGYGSQRYVNNSSTSFTNKNTSVGYQSLRGSTNSSDNDGNSNSAFGYESLYSNTTGYDNTAIGFQTLYSDTWGDQNVAIGYQALYHNTQGNYNTASGWRSLYMNITGNYNSAYGFGALDLNTGSYNTAIGYASGVSSDTPIIQSTAIGCWSNVNASFQVRIGNAGTTSIGGYAPWSNLSDIRYKSNIREDVLGLDFIMNLRPITYNLNVELLANKLGENISFGEDGNRLNRELSTEELTSRIEKGNKREVGFVAQEVEALANRLHFDFSGVEVPENEDSFYRIRYAEFVVPLVKAVQEQQQMIEELRAEIDALKRKGVR